MTDTDPQLDETHLRLLDERADAEQALDDLHGQLAHLIGYYDREGAVPVEKLSALVPGLSPDN